MESTISFRPRPALLALAIVCQPWLCGLSMPLAMATEDMNPETSLEAKQEANGDSPGQSREAEPFEYEYFAEMVSLSPQKEKIRLCGLDKVCMEMWKSGRLAVMKNGKFVLGNFDGTGDSEEAMILEQDSKTGARDYFVFVTSPRSEGRMLLAEELIPDVHNIVDFFWDPSRKAFAVDTGERLMKQDSTLRVEGSAPRTVLTGQSGLIEKVFTWITWNPQQKCVVFSRIRPKLSDKSASEKHKHTKDANAANQMHHSDADSSKNSSTAGAN